MSAIVDRLRKGPAPIQDPDLNDDAADTIEAQAEKIRMLREALRPFAEVDLRTQGVHRKFAEHVLRARAALEATK